MLDLCWIWLVIDFSFSSYWLCKKEKHLFTLLKNFMEHSLEHMKFMP